jgi:hypothetical protein
MKEQHLTALKHLADGLLSPSTFHLPPSSPFSVSQFPSPAVSADRFGEGEVIESLAARNLLSLGSGGA